LYHALGISFSSRLIFLAIIDLSFGLKVFRKVLCTGY
jgi:hypothetical protein